MRGCVSVECFCILRLGIDIYWIVPDFVYIKKSNILKPVHFYAGQNDPGGTLLLLFYNIHINSSNPLNLFVYSWCKCDKSHGALNHNDFSPSTHDL